MKGHYADLWHRIALAAPDRPAIVTVGEGTLTNAEFDAAAARFAALLTELGVGRDDKVSILLYNRPEWLVAFAGCLRLGVVPVPLNFRYRPREFMMAAARYTRFRLHLKHSGVPTAVQAYRLNNPLAAFLVGVMYPLGYALYRRDRRRGVA